MAGKLPVQGSVKVEVIEGKIIAIDHDTDKSDVVLEYANYLYPARWGWINYINL